MNKIYFRNSFLAFFLLVSFASYSQIISTIAGDGVQGYFGDGGPATVAEFYNPSGVVVDHTGNIFIADWKNNTIRIINTSGIINTLAGNGYNTGASGGGYTGNGGPATDAELDLPQGITLDNSGNVYIAEENNNVIRKVNTSGIISTIAGNGYGAGAFTGGYTGNGGQATDAELNYPCAVAVDNTGNIYIVDNENAVIREVNTSGIISTIAGVNQNGFSGDGGQATNAQLYLPFGIALGNSGNIYIADSWNECIRKINTAGIINTFAGNNSEGAGYSGDGGPATAAELNNPNDLTVDDSGNVYIADEANQRIRKVNTSGTINTIVGNGYSAGGFSGDGGEATAAELNYPYDVALDAAGNIYIADTYNNRIRKVTSPILGISSIALVTNDITVYPIPTSGSFSISGIAPGQTIELYNYIGQKVLSSISYQSSANFYISNQPNGIYLIRISNKDGIVVTEKKIVKTE